MTNEILNSKKEMVERYFMLSKWKSEDGFVYPRGKRRMEGVQEAFQLAFSEEEVEEVRTLTLRGDNLVVLIYLAKVNVDGKDQIILFIVSDHAAFFIDVPEYAAKMLCKKDDMIQLEFDFSKKAEDQEAEDPEAEDPDKEDREIEPEEELDLEEDFDPEEEEPDEDYGVDLDILSELPEI